LKILTNKDMKRVVKKKLKYIANGILLISIVMLTFAASFAQQIERGFKSANTYAATGLEVVNTTNGNMMLNIPVASLPAGRGTSPGYTVNLQYNSKLWDSHQATEDDGEPGENSNSYYSFTTLGLSDRGGWRLSQAYVLQVSDRLNFETPDVCHLNDPVSHLDFRWKVEMEMPDGSVKTFYPETGRGYGTGMGSDGYANIDYNGVKYIATQGQLPGSGICTTSVSTQSISTSGMTYITMDGSRLKLYVPYQPSVQPILRNWKLYFPNGTVVENYPPDNSAVAQRLTDRNGNYIEHIENKIIDQLGRYIEFTSDTNGDYIVRVKGVGGEAVETRIRWGTEWVQKKYTKSTALNAPSYNRYETVSTSIQTVEKIIFPTQLGTQSIDFEYNGSATQPGTNQYSEGWGEIKRITLPTGAKSEYDYAEVGQGEEENTAENILERFASSKDLIYTEQYDNQSVLRTDTWLYNVSKTANGMTSPSGAVNSEYLSNNQYISTWDNGMSYKSVNPDGSLVERIWAYNLPYSVSGGTPNVPGGFAGVGSANAYVKTEFTTVSDSSGNPSLTAIKDYKYDKNGNVLEIKEYDWVAYSSVPRSGSGVFSKVTGLPSSGLVLKRKIINTYYNQAADADSTTANSNSYNDPSSPKLKNIIKSTEIQDGSGTPVSRSEFFYDDPDNKGNLIETKIWDSYKNNGAQAYSNTLTSSNSISTTAQYDQYGNPTLIVDAKNNQTQITYGAILGPNGTVSGLYPTQTVAAYGTAVAQTVTAEYDFYTGLMKKFTTLGNTTGENVSSETEYDALGRVKKVKSAVGTALEAWTQTEYDDAARRVILKSDLETKGDGKKVAVQHYDELGRLRLTRTIENIATEDPTNEAHGIKVQTRYLTGNPYSYQLTSNPYRAATSSGATNEQSMGWTRLKAINTGKKSEVETFSGASLPAPWGSNTSSSGVIKTDNDADRALITDQAGKQRISKMNALGNLTDVWEITAADSATVAVTFPNQTLSAGYKTSYVYDALSNLKTVTQGSQARNFTYSSLSRLLSATNPESGTTSYQYDANGNLTRRTDARLIQANYTYDALNRITQRSYANEPTGQTTPTINYTYDDTNVSNSKGKLTKVSSLNSTTEYTAFDITGKALSHKQTTDGNVYTTAYTYNLSGALIEETYPSGRVVKNVLDNDGELSMVQSKKNQNAGYWNYAQHFTYTATGAVGSMQLGNGRWESTQFNSRLQPIQIALGTTQNAANLLKLDYEYGVLNLGTGQVDTTANNGNIGKQTITVPTETRNSTTYNGFTAAQYYAYDNLNRIQIASENMTPNGQTMYNSWKQTFTYDRYGNRNFDEANTTTLPKNCSGQVCAADVPVVNPSINTTTNKNQLNGYIYDNAGNTTKDAQSRKFIYDGENKQTKVENLDSNGNPTSTVGEYFYDGDGKRVKKIAGTEVTIFVYDAEGKLVAEYSNQIASNPQVSYLTEDNLGSPRINTDKNGNVISRHDYQPFGEEIQRASYGADNVRKKFTGYERDDESELDFSEARYLNNRQGRFTSVDPLMASSSVYNPQTFNRYSYVVNNPLNLTDPTGMKAGCPEGQTCQYDNNGAEYYINGAGAVVYTGVIATVVSVSVKEVAKEVIIEPKWYEMFWYYTKKAVKTTGKGVMTVGRLGGALLTILTNPTSVGCSGLYEVADGNGGCTFSQERYDELNPKLEDESTEPSDDNPKENPTEEQTPSDTKKKKEKKKKKTKKTGKEKASDVPNYAKGQKRLPGESPTEFATRVMTTAGVPITNTGPGSDFSKIKKMGSRQ
jgi:RHS repeat-associated protein